ncbi:MAG TPA: hypothetical protein P5120_15930 [Spirochaetota bacterium]|nr:hypothetical protein [Spirochaetota bacterium]
MRFYIDSKMQRSFIIKAENIVLIIIAVAALFFTSCSPVDKVKWSNIDLLGNEIPVWRIVRGLSGKGGTVEWSQEKQTVMKDWDVVSAKISRKDRQFLLLFSYDRKEKECRLVEYRINGKPESPFYIYRYVTLTRYRYLPESIDYFFDPSDGR